MVDAVDGLSPASQRTNDPGATLALPDSQGDKTADQGAADAQATGPTAGMEQDAKAKPGTAAGPGGPGATNEDGARPSPEKVNQIDLDVSISKNDVRQ